ELALYNKTLKDKIQIVALNKSDLDSKNNADKFIEKFEDQYKIFKISAATTSGIKEMINFVTTILEKTEDRKFEIDEKIDETFLEEFYNKKEEFDLNYIIEDGIYIAY